LSTIAKTVLPPVYQERMLSGNPSQTFDKGRADESGGCQISDKVQKVDTTKEVF